MNERKKRVERHQQQVVSPPPPCTSLTRRECLEDFNGMTEMRFLAVGRL
jgi:hypothetical protein